MKINSLADLKRMGGIKAQGDTDCPTLFDIDMCNQKDEDGKPNFCLRCKIFEIDSCHGNGRICLVYLEKNEHNLDKRENPKIWLLDRCCLKKKNSDSDNRRED